MCKRLGAFFKILEMILKCNQSGEPVLERRVGSSQSDMPKAWVTQRHFQETDQRSADRASTRRAEEEANVDSGVSNLLTDAASLGSNLAEWKGSRV